MPRRVAPWVVREPLAPPGFPWAVPLLIAMGCENVTTTPAEKGANGQVVVLDSTATSAMEIPTEAPLAETLVEGDGIIIDDAPPVSNSARAAESFVLELASETLMEQQCRTWIDAPESQLQVTDLEVRILRSDSDEVGELLARTLPEQCSPVLDLGPMAILVSFDGGTPETAPSPVPSDAGLGPALGDSDVLWDAAVRSDAGLDAGSEVDSPPAEGEPTDGGEGFAEIDLAVEGWHLTNVSDGLWLEFCPNACYTVTRVPNGRVSVTVWYRVTPSEGAK